MFPLLSGSHTVCSWADVLHTMLTGFACWYYNQKLQLQVTSQHFTKQFLQNWHECLERLKYFRDFQLVAGFETSGSLHWENTVKDCKQKAHSAASPSRNSLEHSASSPPTLSTVKSWCDDTCFPHVVLFLHALVSACSECESAARDNEEELHLTYVNRL